MTDTKIKTVADELRDAAQTLRDTAARATRGPWTSGKPSWAGANAVLNTEGHPVTICGDEVEGADHPASADAAWIAMTSPAVAEPLAWLLEEIARQYEMAPCDHPDGVCNGCERRDDFVAAEIVARVLNGATS